jgi:hypothetical protein
MERRNHSIRSKWAAEGKPIRFSLAKGEIGGAGDSYAPLAGAPLFAPPASGGIWAAAHQCWFLRFFIFFLFFVIIFEGFFWFCFY